MKNATRCSMVLGMAFGLMACGEFDSSNGLRADGAVQLRNDSDALLEDAPSKGELDAYMRPALRAASTEETPSNDSASDPEDSRESLRASAEDEVIYVDEVVEVVQDPHGKDTLEQGENSDAVLEGGAERAPQDLALVMSMLYGTWQGDLIAGQFNSLVLMTDQRFHSTEGLICVKAPCNPMARDGTYSVSMSGGRLYLVLREQSDQKGKVYEIAPSGDTLGIRQLVSGAKGYALQRAGIAWCATSHDCNVQNLPVGIIAGNYVCEQNACAWKPAMLSEM